MKRIVVFGAFGFIGSGICGRIIQDILSSDRHDIELLAVGRSGTLGISHPFVQEVHLDVLQSGFWDFLNLLNGVFAIVNCVGVVEDRDGIRAEDVNALWMDQMLHAAAEHNVRSIVYISAIGTPDFQDPPTHWQGSYFRSRFIAEKMLRMFCDSGVHSVNRTQPAVWILRPSMVYGTSCYGGSEGIRYLAGSPGPVPLAGKGDVVFSPVCLQDLAEVVRECLVRSSEGECGFHVQEVAGPEILSLKEMIVRTRRWLGFSYPVFISVPMPIMKVFAFAGSYFPMWNLTPGILEQMNGSDFTARSSVSGKLKTVMGIPMQDMTSYLVAHPAGNPEKWHARIGFLRPFLSLSMAVIWLFGGIVSLMKPSAARQEIPAIVRNPALRNLSAKSFSVLDLVFGAAIISGRPRWGRQLGLVGFYTVALGVLRPSLWLDLLGRLVKNFAIIAILAVLRATQGRRG